MEEAILYIVLIAQDIRSKLFGLKGWEKFFAEYFGFLFDNTSRCYLVFTSLFFYSLSFIFIVVCLWLWLRELLRLLHLIYSYSALR